MMNFCTTTNLSGAVVTALTSCNVYTLIGGTLTFCALERHVFNEQKYMIVLKSYCILASFHNHYSKCKYITHLIL